MEPVRRLVCALLTERGYRCWEASDGAEALSLAESRIHELNLVVTDVVMPHMNGSELATRLASLRPDLPILFMSGYSDDPLLEAIVRSGLLLLPKPFTSDSLWKAVQRAMALPQTRPPRPGLGSRLQ